MYTSSFGFQVAIVILGFLRFFTQKRYLSDEVVIKKQFKKAHGYELDLNDCKTINEKMQWLKLYDRSSLHTLCADKLKARDYFFERFGNKYLVEMPFYTSNWKDVTPENMPNFPFIIKPNHGSGWYKIVHNKNEVDWDELRTQCRYWLSQNYYYVQREWQYKNIKPYIIVEKLLISKNGNIPTNYRVHCMNGKVELIALTIYPNQNPDEYKNLKFDRNWFKLDFDWADKYTDLSKLRYDMDYPKPNRLDDIIKIAEEVSKQFSYVRVDMYELDDKIYHGELTFHDGGGFDRITPFEWDKHFGSLVDLK